MTEIKKKDLRPLILEARLTAIENVLLTNESTKDQFKEKLSLAFNDLKQMICSGDELNHLLPYLQDYLDEQQAPYPQDILNNNT